MAKVEHALAAFLVLVATALLGFVLVSVWMLWLGPAFEQSAYPNDVRLQGLSGELSYDCRLLDHTKDPVILATVKQDIAVKGAPPLDLSKVGMPPETRQCVIDVVHEEAKR